MPYVLLVLSLVIMPLVAAERDVPPTGERSGVDVGVIMEVMPMRGAFVLKSDQGHIRTYTPQWRGGLPKEGGGLDPEIVQGVRQLKVDDRVALRWEWKERFFVVKMRREGGDEPHSEKPEKPAATGKPNHEKPHHGQPKHEKPDHGKPGSPPHPLADQLDAKPAQTAGWITGTVVRVDPKGMLILKDDAGVEHRLVPHWRGGMPQEGGGFDQTMIECMSYLKPGQVVKARWEWEERPRLAELTY